MFKKICNMFQSTSTLQDSQVELIKLQKQVSDWEQKANEIQTRFDFSLPNYIIDEIIQNEDSKSFVNLHYLINCAVVNEKISKSNANLLKQIYSFKNS